ncbi:hypothetical protein [Streptomyces ferrugineus]|uniref:hypothetical protein n=1 Tax=Streptomyces ferrugineus TaxID=1413221 RepID=UPI001D138D88|nr:hypothetical protein [Streptomyces ferrugineus]
MAERGDRSVEAVEVLAPLPAHRRVDAECGQCVSGQVLQQRTAVQQQHLADRRGQPLGITAVTPAGQDSADPPDRIVDTVGSEHPVGQGQPLEAAEPVEGGELAEQIGIDDHERPGVGADLATPCASELGAA